MKDMSTSAIETGYTPKQERLRRYLLRETDGKSYFKSRLIGEDLEMSPKEVGANLATIAERDPTLSIERWGYSSSTTWMVST